MGENGQKALDLLEDVDSRLQHRSIEVKAMASQAYALLELAEAVRSLKEEPS